MVKIKQITQNIIMKCNTYVDEAGQTGFNIWDCRMQPFFVLAGVTIDENTSDLADYVENVFKEHKQSNQTEFKTHEWLKYTNRRQCVLNMFSHIRKHAIDINVVVVEKKFMIAALIVHKFFDGAYNDYEDYTWVNDKNERLKAANYYYESLTDDDLYEIGKCTMHPNKKNIRAIWDILWKKTTEPRYKMVLVGVEDHLDEIITEFDAIVSNNSNLHATVTNSPNFTAFSQLGNMIAMSAMKNEFSTRIIFDNCPSCNSEFEFVFKLFQQASIQDRLFAVFGIGSWKNRVTDFLIGDSKQDYNLQTADVVASLVFYVFKNTLTNTIPQNFDKNIIDQLKAMIEIGQLWYVASNRFITQFMNCN